jgi:hypothetical protein
MATGCWRGRGGEAAGGVPPAAGGGGYPVGRVDGGGAVLLDGAGGEAGTKMVVADLAVRAAGAVEDSGAGERT